MMAYTYISFYILKSYVKYQRNRTEMLITVYAQSSVSSSVETFNFTNIKGWH
jgi:hypothetical protein